MTARLLAPLCALLFAASAVAPAAEPVPDASSWVNDYAGVLTAQQADRLESKLAAHERATSNQVVVVIIKSLNGRDIEGLALAIVEKAPLGQKGKDNGVLLLVAVGDRRARIEAGRGLEGALPDIVCGRIIRDEMGPLFSQGRIYEGIDVGTDRIIQAVKGEYRPGRGLDEQRLPALLLTLALLVVTVCHYLNRALGGIVGAVAGFLLGLAFLGVAQALGAALGGAVFGLFAREILLIMLLSGRGRWGVGGGRGGGWSGGGGFRAGGGMFSGGGASGSW